LNLPNYQKNIPPSGSHAKILIVEDEPHLAFNLELNLRSEGFQCQIAADGPKAIEAFENGGPFELIILDVMLPDINGFEVAEYIRKKDDQTQILMLTAMGREEDRIRGLEVGADDYITKPFHLKEFLLRVKRMIRRSAYFSKESTAPDENKQITGSFQPLLYGPFTLNTETLELSHNGQKISLTALETDVLREFFLNPDRVLSRGYLLQKVWGINGDIETRTVDNFIVRLRRYLEADPGKPIHLVSVRGRGYRLNKLPPTSS
jgi:DNA-binding response OmpR family regulator